MLVCGCGSLDSGVGADVGVGLTVTEHTAQHDTHLWTYYAPAAVWLFWGTFCVVWRRLANFKKCAFFLTDAPFLAESRGMRTLQVVWQSVVHPWTRPCVGDCPPFAHPRSFAVLPLHLVVCVLAPSSERWVRCLGVRVLGNRNRSVLG